MFISVRRCAEPRIQLRRLKVKVTMSCDLPLNFMSTPLPLKGISLNYGQVFISGRRCVEPMTKLRCTNGKVTVKVMGFNLEFNVRSTSPLPLHEIIKFWRTVRLTEAMCKTHDSAMQTQGQDHSLNTLFTIKFWSNVYLRETMCRTYDSTTQDSRSQLKAMGVSREFRVRYISPSALFICALQYIFCAL